MSAPHDMDDRERFWRGETDVDLLEDVERFMCRFVSFTTPHQSKVCALWVMHNYVIRAASTTPYLRPVSATPESGKSRLLEVLQLLLGDDRAVMASSLTPSTIFRAREEYPLAFLIDEVDNLAARKDDAARELLAVVNSGYRLGATAMRTVSNGKTFSTKRFPIFGPTALAGLGRLTDTTESRCVQLLLMRAPEGAVEDFMYQLVEPQAEPLRKRLEQWGADQGLVERLRKARPDLSALAGLRDRVREVWWPLIAIADEIGGAWPRSSREAAVAIHGGSAEKDTSDQILLLAHIKEVFTESKVEIGMPSVELLEGLVLNEEGPWGRYWGEEVQRCRASNAAERPLPLKAMGELARKLKPFGIKPAVHRMDNDVRVRGYTVKDFEPIFGTYLLEHRGDTEDPPGEVEEIVEEGPSPTRDKRDDRDAAGRDVTGVTGVTVPGGKCPECGAKVADPAYFGHSPSCSRFHKPSS